MRVATTVVFFALAACQPAAPPAAPATPLPSATVLADGGAVDPSSLDQRLDEADMICVGEQHDDPAHHETQHALLERMIERHGDRELALGLEMVQRPWQDALNDFGAGRIDAARLAEVVDWERRWGYDFAMYAPMLHAAHDNGVQLLALNAPRSLSRALARGGLDGLPADVRESLPELDVTDEAHRRFFWAAMGFGDPSQPNPHGDNPHNPHGSNPHNPHGDNPHNPHGHGGGDMTERFYLAQVLWDETMAEGTAAWLDKPARKVMVLAGNGHCHHSAIPHRVKRRRPEAKVLSILLQTGDTPLPEHATSDFVLQIPAPATTEELASTTRRQVAQLDAR